MKLFRFILLALLINPILALSNSVEGQFCAITRPSLIVNLDEATSLILAFIQNNSLTMMIEKPEGEALELLLKNFSPAEIAFEAEVLNAQQPTIAFFATKDIPNYDAIKALLEECASRFNKRCNFVEIDIKKLFKIAQIARIKEVPTLLFLHNRMELDRISNTIEEEELIEKIECLLSEVELIQ